MASPNAEPLSTSASHTRAMADDEFVTITGLVHFATPLGVFLDVDDLRVFVPANCTSMPSRTYCSGESVVIDVVRRYAQRHRFGG